MNAFLATALSALNGALASLALLATLITGAAVMNQGNLLGGLMAFGVGLLATIMVFGLLAMIADIREKLSIIAGK